MAGSGSGDLDLVPDPDLFIHYSDSEDTGEIILDDPIVIRPDYDTPGEFSQQEEPLSEIIAPNHEQNWIKQVHRDDENTVLLLFYLFLGISGFLIIVMSLIAIYITFLKEELTLAIDLRDQSREFLLETEEQTGKDNYVIQRIDKRTIPNRALSTLSKAVFFLQLCVKKLSLLPSKFYKNVSNDGVSKMIETS